MMRTVLIVAAVAAVMYALACAALFVMQRSLLYFPPPGPTHGDITFALPVEEARVLVSTRSAPGSAAVVYFGGNGEDVPSSLPTLEGAFPEAAIFALHYRGYSGSSGSPSEVANVADALVLFDVVQAKHPHVTVIGRSLGSGVAVQIASQRAVDRLVLVTPYDSIANLAAHQYPFFPVRWLLLDKYESWRYAPRITAPTLLVAADQDEVIPRASTEALYRQLPRGLATLTTVPGAGHNTISETPAYETLLAGKP